MDMRISSCVLRAAPGPAPRPPTLCSRQTLLPRARRAITKQKAEPDAAPRHTGGRAMVDTATSDYPTTPLLRLSAPTPARVPPTAPPLTPYTKAKLAKGAASMSWPVDRHGHALSLSRSRCATTRAARSPTGRQAVGLRAGRIGRRCADISRPAPQQTGPICAPPLPEPHRLATSASASPSASRRATARSVSACRSSCGKARTAAVFAEVSCRSPAVALRVAVPTLVVLL